MTDQAWELFLKQSEAKAEMLFANHGAHNKGKKVIRSWHAEARQVVADVFNTLQQRGWPHATLISYCSCSGATVNRWSRGNPPNLEMLEKLKRWLDEQNKSKTTNEINQ